ncbi:hypothetical protein PRIPAC_87197 [Pristionchus pacificus]|uniref:Uncharacterized protein n=1 Tax=Pristionchus pacificus TaxID=54126 RepID=A0A2A6CWA0_PRIPA|nr:hypothetical protein PRIPAC_87197 [Pristionchus pacificus]|eukprot:PDM82291.1 hypothetical protein PRIPAC_36684 [Pristionchus pacificus]
MTGDDWQFEGNEEDAALREEIEEMSDQRTRERARHASTEHAVWCAKPELINGRNASSHRLFILHALSSVRRNTVGGVTADR